MKTCVINFADGIFIKGQERLRQSLQSIKYEGNTIFFTKLEAGWPVHQKVPWGFKVYAFEEARKRGETMILWIDAAGIVVRPLDQIFEKIKKDGVFIFSRFNGSVGEMSSDYALKALNITREEAFHIPEISAFSIGINFNHPKGKAFFDEWKKRADDGISFLGLPDQYTLNDSLVNRNGLLSINTRVRGHRHDQTIASIIAYKMGIKPTKRYIFDLVGEARAGHEYANYIPFDTKIVQNRDIKNEKYLKDLSIYVEPPNNRRLIIFIWTSWRTAERYLKDYIKYIFIYKKRYKILFLSKESIKKHE